MIMIRASFLWLVICGYCLYLRRRNVNIDLAPAIVTTGIGVVVFLAGLLNVMTYAVIAICVGGIILGVYAKPYNMIKEKLLGRKEIESLMLFSFVCLCMAIRLYGFKALHYDNFSHWLTVITEMNRTDMLPNFASEMIRFQGYPTGSAGVSYFFCKIIGESDAIAVFAQSVLLIACLATIRVFMSKIRVSTVLIIMLASIYCLVANIQVTELLVDTLISVLGIAALSIILYYQNDLFKATMLSLPIQIFLIIVKNSGILFVFLNAVVLVGISIWNNIITKEKIITLCEIKCGIISACSPLFVLLLWNKHVEYVFPNGTTSKHSMTIDNYTNVLGEKSLENIKEIIYAFVDRFVSFNKAVIVMMILIAIVLLGYSLKEKKDRYKAELLIAPALVMVYLGFMAVLAAMYILSMPYEEARVLASYERYEKQILLWLVGMGVIYAVACLQKVTKRNKALLQKTLLIVLFGALLYLEKDNIPELFMRTDYYTGSKREQLELIKKENDLPENARYFIYGDSITNDAGYMQYCARYVFWSNAVKACAPEALDEYKESIQSYDYLIILQEDDQINDVLKSYEIPLDKEVYYLKQYFE